MAKVVIGAGEFRNNPGWLYTQEDELNLLRREDWAARFAPASIEAILAEHVWEHLTLREAGEAAVLCYEFLRLGGHIRVAVPDFHFPNEEYHHICQVGGPGPADHPAASHQVFYTYQTLTKVFEQAGFQVNLLEYCDEFGEFHEHPWADADGVIYRSRRHDHRNRDGVLRSMSLILDARKTM
ncbi:class I SAM-dependent methyltransferase [Tumebacillus permanentifrigoris]|uniref:Putative SAM-dependent methyltransferase n=1 Tax=Tumebacillus permanentifrigoris TaxID=378543 RepID=A0A316D5K3_9BACL|nr:putative SAM-dependent methyltransferase [Tumebacillus permanentifrigoris]